MYTTNRAKTEICPRSSKNQARCPNLFVAMELSKIIKSKVVRLPAAIELASQFLCVLHMYKCRLAQKRSDVDV